MKLGLCLFSRCVAPRPDTRHPTVSGCAVPSLQHQLSPGAGGSFLGTDRERVREAEILGGTQHPDSHHCWEGHWQQEGSPGSRWPGDLGEETASLEALPQLRQRCLNGLPGREHPVLGNGTCLLLGYPFYPFTALTPVPVTHRPYVRAPGLFCPEPLPAGFLRIEWRPLPGATAAQHCLCHNPSLWLP